MKLVLDTNVLMELLHYRDPRSLALMQAITEGRVTCFTDSGCLTEFERVLAYPQFKLDEAAQRSLHTWYRSFATSIDAGDNAVSEAETATLLPRCRDTDDQKFMELAARTDADLLITRDKELLRLARSRARPAPFSILTPERAIALLTTVPALAPEQTP
ncbi:MAG: putative toxin-antitoxin system toxin component, PIN family [Rhodocyclaceae bacterium]